MSEQAYGSSEGQEAAITAERVYIEWRHDRSNFKSSDLYTMNIDFIEYRDGGDDEVRPVALIDTTSVRGEGAFPHIDERLIEQGIEQMYVLMGKALGVPAYIVAHTETLTRFWVRQFGMKDWKGPGTQDQYKRWLEKL